MKTISFLVVLLLPSYLFSQSHQGLILTKKGNYEWLENLETYADYEKLEKIKERILLDTNCVLTKCCPDGIIWIKPENKIACECKPLIIIGEKQFYFSNETLSSKIEELSRMLSSKNIKEVRIYTDKDKNAWAIFGIQSECGIIILEPKNHRIKRKFDKLELM